MDWESLPFDPYELENYLSGLTRSDVKLEKVVGLTGKTGIERIKGFFLITRYTPGQLYASDL